jgi:hypothetical protein
MEASKQTATVAELRAAELKTAVSPEPFTVDADGSVVHHARARCFRGNCRHATSDRRSDQGWPEKYATLPARPSLTYRIVVMADGPSDQPFQLIAVVE